MYINSVDDPRFGFDKFRRKQLENIAILEKIQFKHGSPATTLRVLLQDQGIDPSKYERLIYPDALTGNISNEQKPPNLEEEVRQIIEDVDYDRMGIEELQKECELQGISFHHKNKEKALRAKLNGNTA